MNAVWRTALRRVTRRVWGRLALQSLIAIGFVVIVSAAGDRLPRLALVDLGQDSVTTILTVLASSMLAVTTFSLNALIAAYSSAAQAATPRATRLLVEDPTSQNALAGFLGAFVFAIAGIVALASGYVSEQAKVVLFLGTLGVIAWVVVTLVRWIEHLTRFGRMADIVDRVEDAALVTLVAHARRPHLGAEPPREAATPVVAIRAPRAGFVTLIALDRLSQLATRRDLRIHLRVAPGDDVAVGTVLAEVEGNPGDDDRGQIADAVAIERHRTYEQDPRLGMVALGEIASRALSPATNDQGTAIEVLGALQRVMTEALGTAPDPEVVYPGVHASAVSLDDLLADGFRPVARDGAGMVEVALRLQRALEGVAISAPLDARGAIRSLAEEGRRRALASLDDEFDRAAVSAAARWAAAAGSVSDQSS